jgi:hypothetical protein
MAGTPFREARNVELSLLYYLEQNLAADWSGTTVVKTFKKVYARDTALPIVCVRLADTSTTRLEVGSDTLDNRYLLVIDIFVSDDGMRLDLTDYIKSKLKSGWVHYDHSKQSGSPSALVRSANGRDYVLDFVSDTRVDATDSADEKDQYRQSISVRVRKAS